MMWYMQTGTISNKIFSSFLLLIISVVLFGEEQGKNLTPGNAWSDDFSEVQKNNLPAKWKTEGKKIGVPITVCAVNNGILQIKCNKSTGGIIIAPEKVDLKKTPVMRWRWRLLSYPEGADGRVPAKDDQPIAIYLGTQDGMIKKKSIAYRWENLTPQGYEGDTSYAGILKVHFVTMRDHKTPIGQWVTESRNVAEDFKRIYGKVPKEFALSIIGNSQYTGSNTVAELDFIEFIAENERAL